LLREVNKTQKTHLVVERSPLGVNDHRVKTSRLVLLQLLALVPHLRELVDALDVGSVRSRSEDSSAKAVTALVGGSHEGTAGVVDEGGGADVDVLAVESVLEELDDVLADSVLALEALSGENGLTLV
jgi:hypothetical protein